MTRVGITGHQRLDAAERFGAEGAWSWLRAALAEALWGVEPPLVGLSSLAAGTDQLFAELILQCRGRLEAVLPFRGYDDLLAPHEREHFAALARHAHVEYVLDAAPAAATARSEAYFRAGQIIVDRADRMFAVLERRAGSETDRVVEYARERGRALTIFDPWRRTTAET